MRLLLAAILFCCLAPGARADSFPADAKTEWTRYFAGEPMIPDPEQNLARMVASPETRCQSIQQDIVTRTIAYGRQAFASDRPGSHADSKSKKIAAGILKTLHELENSRDDCFESVAKTYLAASLHLLEPLNSNVGAAVYSPLIDGRPMASGLELTLLGTALLNLRDPGGKPVVEILTVDRRSGKDMGSVWLKTTTPESKDYLVAAGYDCLSRHVLIDPYRAPLDLGATFVHEIDHLFRDRVNLPGEPEKDGTLSGRIALEIALDESLASIVSAYYGRGLRRFRSTEFRPLAWELFRHVSYPLPFRLSGDNTGFRDSKDSPINRIWSLFDRGVSAELMSVGVPPSPALFLSKIFLRGDRDSELLTRDLPQAPLAEIDDIYQTISRGYFGGLSLSDAELGLLDPSLHGRSDDPLALWLVRYRILPDQDVTGLRSANPDAWVWELPADRYYPRLTTDGSPARIVFDLETYFAGLDSALSQLYTPKDPSPYCEDYLRGLQDGELKAYIGSELSSGMKSGETGVKGGETGVKGALVRPCLDLRGEL